MKTMTLFKSAVGALALSLALPVAAAVAEDSIYVPLFTYRTGPFAGSGTSSSSSTNARPATTPRRASSATTR
jgi:hypothetical protein